MSDKFFVGLDLTRAEDNGVQRPISRVTLLLDDENSITAGDDTGMELLADCPHATQAMANAILAQVKGYQYQMFEAGDAALDPSAELGDGVTAGGLYSVISRLDDDGSGYSGISAPGESELEDEYPTSGPMTQTFNRKIAQTNSRITKTAEQIRLEVSNEIGGLSASIDVQLSGITQRVEDTENGLSQTLRVAADGVTITNAQGSVLTIDGGQVDATKIKTQDLDASRINASDLNLTGVISWGDLDGGAQGQITSAQSTAGSALSVANSAWSTANSAQNTVSGWKYPGSTYIDGSMLMTGTVKASTLQGGSIGLMDGCGALSGYITLTEASSAGYAVDLTSYGALRITAQAGDMFLRAAQYDRHIVLTYNGIFVNSVFCSINAASLGTSAYKWSDVYANNSVIQTSDLSLKKGVQYGLEAYDALFDALKPMSFIFVDGESGRRHLGLGAQDVEAAMEQTGVSSMEFAGFIKSERSDEEVEQRGEGYDYALRYGEFIPLCIYQIQQNKEQIRRLKTRIGELERSTA